MRCSISLSSCPAGWAPASFISLNAFFGSLPVLGRCGPRHLEPVALSVHGNVFPFRDILDDLHLVGFADLVEHRIGFFAAHTSRTIGRSRPTISRMRASIFSRSSGANGSSRAKS